MEIIFFIIYIVVFLYSVILHEIAHGFVAERFGDDTARAAGRLSFNPLVHIDPFGSIALPALLFFSSQGAFTFGYAKPVPVNGSRLRGGPVAFRWVAMAGIITNIVLAILAATVLKIVTVYTDLGVNNLGVMFFNLLFLINIVLAVFNALPFPGFDGFNFLTTFKTFSRIISQTPLGNPLFMARYGLIVSLAVLLLAWSFVGQIIYFFVNLVAGLFGLG